MDFPVRPGKPVAVTDVLAAALGARPREAYMARDLLAIFDAESEARSLRPDFPRIASLDAFAVIVSAPGDAVDFVSRFFAPGAGIPEDPVTGSSHCTLAPYWAARLPKNRLTAKQLSPRALCSDWRRHAHGHHGEEPHAAVPGGAAVPRRKAEARPIRARRARSSRTLSGFVEDAMRRNVEFRYAQKSFIERGYASRFRHVGPFRQFGFDVGGEMLGCIAHGFRTQAGETLASIGHVHDTPGFPAKLASRIS